MFANAPSVHHIGHWALLDYRERRQRRMLGDLTQAGYGRTASRRWSTTDRLLPHFRQ